MLNQLERRFGRFAIPNLTLTFVLIQVVTYVMSATRKDLPEKIALIPQQVLDGQYYRLLTFLADPPTTNIVFAFFFWYLFYLMGTTLESLWGTFQYNVYLLLGYVATVSASFLTPQIAASSGFLQGSVFLAFAFLNPNFVMQIFFIIPVRIKWLAMLTWIGYGAAVVFGDLHIRIVVCASVLNFLLFFWRDILYKFRGGRRHMLSQVRAMAHKPPAFLHQCEVCGITDATDPLMEFRYCSQCSGERCYCGNHLRNHVHVTQETVNA